MLSITTATNPLTASLQAQGVSAQKAQLVESDLAASVAAAGGGASATDSGTKADPAVMRKVLDQRIAADVTAGKLTQADADKIGKALDDMAAKSSDSPVAPEGAASGSAATPAAASAAPARGAHGGGGGGGSSKTEVSETVTVAGGMATTTITYSDGSTEVTTAVATSAQDAKAARPADANAANAASAYAPPIAPGALVDATG